MKTTGFLVLAVLFVILPAPSFAQPNPALRDVREVSVMVTISNSEPNKFGLNPADLKNKVITKLSDAGFKVIEPPNPFLKVPELRISLDMLKLESCGQCVINVRTSLACDLLPPNIDELMYIKADVWKVESGLRAVAVDGLTVEVNDIVQQQVHTFIAARPPMVSVDKKPDVNQPRQQVRKATDEKDTNLVKRQAVESNYVASKNSKVFHKPGCQFAAKISAKNLVSYDSREQAIAAGKRPCKSCNP
jgi:hypothetical protein